MSWAQAYPEAAGDDAIREVYGIHEPFARYIELIKGADQRSLLEVGVGTGAFLAAFAQHDHAVVGIDNDSHIVDQVNWLIGVKGLDAKAEALLVDAFTMPFQPRTFVIAYSQGTMEHFDDSELASLLHEQMRVADWVVFNVPTPAWVNPPLIEPEYRRTEAEWVALLGRLGFTTHFSFTYWNGMMAVVCLLSSENAPPRTEIEDAALELPDDAPPADERVIFTIPEDEAEPVHPVAQRRKTRRSENA